MDDLWEILRNAVPELVRDGEYQVIDVVAEQTMGNAYITFKRGSLTWRVVRDRSQVFLDCWWVEGRPDRWFTVDLLRRLVSDEVVHSSLLDDENASWLSEHLAEIERCFGPANVEETLRRLREFQVERANRLFG